MAVGRIQRKGHILIDTAALRSVLILPADHAALQDIGLLFHSRFRRKCAGLISKCPYLVPLVLRESNNGDPPLVASRIPAIGIQCPAGLRFIKPCLRIIGFHGVAVLGTDAERTYHQFAAPGFPDIKSIQRICYIPFFPDLAFLR